MSLNKAMLIGNLGKDPEIRYVDADKCVASFSLATSDPAYTLPNGTEVAERTEWHNIICWGKLAKMVELYVRKGNKIFVEGSIHTRSYEDRSKVRHYVTEIWAEKIEFCSVAPNKQ